MFSGMSGPWTADSENFILKSELKNLHDSVSHRVAGEVGNRMEAEFAHEIGAMRFRGLDAEMQRHSDFLAGLSFRKQLNHLALSAGQNRGSLILSFLGSGSSTVGNLPIKKPIQYHLADPGGEEGSVQLQSLDGCDQVATRVRLEKKTARSGAKNFANHLIGVVHGQNQDRNLRRGRQ